MQLNATTVRCQTDSSEVTVQTTKNETVNTSTSQELSLECGSGALDGYWTWPPAKICPGGGTNSAMTDSRSNMGCDFHKLPVGPYTILAEDMWNQTVFAYFQVEPSPNHSENLTSFANSISAGPTSANVTPNYTITFTCGVMPEHIRGFPNT
jgi:hypothetical protein